jgi:beta-mannosidase
MTVGPYRPIHLHTYKTRIADVYANALVSPAPELACSLQVTPTFYGNTSDISKIEVMLRNSNPDGPTIRTETFDNGSKIEWTFAPGQVALWWPVGYGEQPLYDVEISVFGKVKSYTISLFARYGVNHSHIYRMEQSSIKRLDASDFAA